MIPARRRAEKFDALVEAAREPGAGSTSSEALRHADLLEVVGALRAVPAVEPRPEFVADLRASLMAEADVVLVRLDAELTLSGARTGTRRHEKRLAVAAGAFALVGATTSMAVAAQSALPGDALYPIKRAMESAETGLTLSDSRSLEMLQHASSRLAEVGELAERDTPQSRAAIPGTITDFTEQARDAADEALGEYAASGDTQRIVDLRDFSATSMRSLEVLHSVLPADVRDELAAAAQELASIDRQALAACPTCGDHGVLSIPTDFVSATKAPVVQQPMPAVEAPALEPKPVAAPSSVPKLPVGVETPAVTPPKDTTTETPKSPLLPGDDDSDEPNLVEVLLDPADKNADGGLDDTVDGLDKTVKGVTGGALADLTDPLIGEGGLLNP